MVQSQEQKNDLSHSQIETRDMEVPSLSDHAANDPLNKIQKEILRYLEAGHTKQQAAEKMGLNVHTFDGRLREIYKIVDVHTMTAAVAKAIREKLI